MYADLKRMTPQSQRNNPHSQDLLGFAKHGQTIHDFGCTITCIAMFAGLTPGEVNDRLKAVNGFQESSVIWTKIQEAIPWVQFVWRGTTYENSKVSQAITDNGSCLVEVDFDGTPRTDDRHWILYIGKQRMNDPWTGTERSTTVYTPRGYAILKRIGNPPTTNEGVSMDVTQLLAKYKKSSVDELDKSIEEHVGITWGAEDQAGGGYLGSARRDITKLKKDLSTALSTPTPPPSTLPAGLLTKSDLEAATVSLKEYITVALSQLPDGRFDEEIKNFVQSISLKLK